MPRTLRADRPALNHPSRHSERLTRVLSHIDAHLDQPLVVERLADLAALSRHHFHRVFLAHLGCSVGAYLTWRRLQRACALLASGREPVLHIALAVGFDSAQSLAKALRRELGTTATAVRRGDAAPWQSLQHPRCLLPFDPPAPGEPPMTPTRWATLPEGLIALTATARGMVDHQMTRAAQQAFTELSGAIGAAGLMPQALSWMCLVPDDPQGPDDPHCRYVAGVVFGHDMASGEGRCVQPALPMSGTLAWQPLAAGRYAVFDHIGPYSRLHHTWRAIYRDWLPASGQTLRDEPPMELLRNHPRHTPPEKLHTEIWIPVRS